MNYLEIAGTLIGLLYLWFEYKASIWLWPVSVIMPAIYIVIYYQALSIIYSEHFTIFCIILRI